MNFKQFRVYWHAQPSRRMSMGGFFYVLRMLKQSASIKGPLLGLFGLSRLLG